MQHLVVFVDLLLITLGLPAELWLCDGGSLITVSQFPLETLHEETVIRVLARWSTLKKRKTACDGAEGVKLE